MIGEVGGEFGHAPAVARAADATAFTGESDQHIVTAVRAPPAGKTMGQDSTRQVLAELTLHILGHGVEVQISLPGEVQIGLQVLRHDLVQDRLGGPSGTVHGRGLLGGLADIFGCHPGRITNTVGINSISETVWGEPGRTRAKSRNGVTTMGSE